MLKINAKKRFICAEESWTQKGSFLNEQSQSRSCWFACFIAKNFNPLESHKNRGIRNQIADIIFKEKREKKP